MIAARTSQPPASLSPISAASCSGCARTHCRRALSRANARQRRLDAASSRYLTRLASPANLPRMVAMRDTAISQLRRGVIEFCVLALLRDSERYGFELVQALA